MGAIWSVTDLGPRENKVRRVFSTRVGIILLIFYYMTLFPDVLGLFRLLSFFVTLFSIWSVFIIAVLTGGRETLAIDLRVLSANSFGFAEDFPVD